MAPYSLGLPEVQGDGLVEQAEIGEGGRYADTEREYGVIGRVLDAGAHGIVAPASKPPAKRD